MTIQQVRTRYGPMFVPDTDTAQYAWIKYSRASAEDEYITECCGFLAERPPGTAVDVGANLGTWSLPLARCCNRVIAVEAQFEMYRLLIKTFTLNRLNGMAVPVNAVASDEPGMLRVPLLDLDRRTNFGGVAIGEIHHEQPDAEMEPVQSVRVDGLIGDSPVTFIKIDVEGMEQAVIRGAADAITRWKPLLFVEAFHPRTDTASLRAQIKAFGYHLTQRGPNYLGLPL